jgi:hypothetical protein
MSQTPFAPTVPSQPDFDIGARYAPPEAEVDGVLPPGAAGQPMWFSVSPLKLMVMCTVTLQFYAIYWFYMQWVLVKSRERSSIWPAARGLFAIFFVYSLCKRVRESATPYGIALNAGMAAIGWAAFSLLWKANSEWVWWFSLAAPVFLLPVQSAMNTVNQQVAKGSPRNDRFTALNWVGIVLGGLFLLLAMVGTVIGDADF